MKSLKPFVKFNRTTLFLIPLILGFFALFPTAQAVSPAPDGAYGPPTYGPGNTAEGQSALFSLTTGQYNTGNGWNSLFSNQTGSFNTAVGAATLFSNTADQNTATGAAALFSNNTGSGNTANGAFALNLNTGSFNTATGAQALTNNTTGADNVAVGRLALAANISGNQNTALGSGALSSNTNSGNTAIGFHALFANTNGHDNTANGDYALVSNIGGNYNTADGNAALFANQSGNQNTALGRNAGSNITTGSGNIDIGAFVSGAGAETNTIRIGDNLPTTLNGSFCYIGGIYGQQTSLSGMAVFVDSTNKLGYQVSSRRFKHDIKVMDKTSEAVLALKPVSFHYNSDKTNTPCFGLIAEDVAAVNPNLIVRDNKGEPLTVRYEAVNVMLLNEFLKEHKKVEAQQATLTELKSTVAQQQKGMEVLTAQLKEQAAQIQKVSARIEMSRPASRVVANAP